ncbi:MAG: 50S ribosomal protein L29 [bacterium]|nr:50S ribosomal protein L29 [bacterium]
MKTKELRQKLPRDLEELLQEKKKRYDYVVEALREKKQKNVKELRGIKKDVARILTIMRETKKG